MVLKVCYLKIRCEAGQSPGRPHGHGHGQDHYQDLSLDLLFGIAETAQLHGRLFDTGGIHDHPRHALGTTTVTVAGVDGVITGGEGTTPGIHRSGVTGIVTGIIIHLVAPVEAEVAAEVEYVAGLAPAHVLLEIVVIEVSLLRGMAETNVEWGAARDVQDPEKQNLALPIVAAVGVRVCTGKMRVGVLQESLERWEVVEALAKGTA